MSVPSQNYIHGTWTDATSGQTFEVTSPADPNDRIGHFPASGPTDVDEAVEAAANTQSDWDDYPAPQRGQILRTAGDLLSDRKADIAEAMTREMGKPFFETKGDVQEAIDTAYYTASETRRLFGNTVPSELPDKMNMSIRRPVGVCAIITAWNFPVAVPSWKIFPALAAGNTVVFKPSEEAPQSGLLFVQTLLDAGLPDGVINVVHGDGDTGSALVEHPQVDAVGFTGSYDVGTSIAETCGRLNKRVSLEMGGKNPMIVMEDADLDLALDGAIWGAFGTTGQRCTATSRLICHEDIHDQFVEMVETEAKTLVLGDGNDDATDVGPLINRDALDKVTRYVEIGQNEGATLSIGGSPAKVDGLDGFFFEPTVFTEVTTDMRIAQEEIFGPVLSVFKVSSYEEAVDVANNTQFGLSSAIYTNNIQRGFQAMRDLDAGITYINGPTIGAEAHMPFGGVKDTGNGHRDGGWAAFEFFTEKKTVYVDYSGQLQKAQMDSVDEE
ncbi:aldehyde dehydrogenase [Salinibacter sp. 10B]|uniref:aldehyde dehydrogenase family protein n=1 Tax=Salinibacter sp. 10B TaxID=1923971 RepID=UPI000CF3ABB4|nr:aldehyde dehydrogenase family protein [Salinibacter sp. 10B]PQJ33454.1 aldehyde dehydrogenase [Salinibacter sp. 10B]